MDCPCGSKNSFDTCCEPYLKGDKQPETAELLMRARYTAFAVADVEYVHKTLVPEARKEFDPASAKKSAETAKWKGLEIHKTEKGGPEDDEGMVEFTATYEHEGQGIEHHEVSFFKRNSKGHWLYVDGDAHTHREGEGHQHHAKQETVKRDQPKIGRNDPCSCGSGKKFKKCCGVAA
jgi:SEC-C motif domain protein